MNDDWLALGCAILAIMLALVGILLPESGSFPPNYPYNNLTGIPQTFPYGNLTGIPNTYPYGNLTGIPNSFPYSNLTGVPNTFPYGNLTNIPNTFPYGNLTGVPIVYNLTDGLVLWLPLNDGIGNASDYSGFMNHGVISDASWVDGKYGKALNFDGINDYVIIPPSVSLAIGNESTISFWLKKTVWNVDSENAVINNNILYAFNGSIYFSIHNTVGLHFRYGGQNDVGERYLNYQGSDGWTNNSEHFIVMMWKRVGSTTYLYLYVDNVLVDSDNTALLISIAEPSWDIGRYATGYTNWLSATFLDEVRGYNRALTQAEITILYNMP